MTLIGVILLVSYVSALVWLLTGYNKVSQYGLKSNKPKIAFSIIIPFRNEAENLPDLLNSLSNINYHSALFEVIFIDDDSQDLSANIIEDYKPSFKFSVLKNKRTSGSPKKDAITLGIKNAKHDWILTTDADCTLPKNWLIAYNDFIVEHQPVFISGGVRFNKNENFLNAFQQWDTCSLQTTTVGAFGLQKPILCNGANLGYKKEAFTTVNGFMGNEHIASGDDIFLLEKIKKKYPKQVSYVKSIDTVVTTKPVLTWAALINQRVRWASKTSAQKNSFAKWLGILLFFVNFYVPAGIIYCFLKPNFSWFFLCFIVVKLFIDYVYIQKSCLFLRMKPSGLSYFGSFVIYPFIIVYIIFKSLEKKYVWKGRTYS